MTKSLVPFPITKGKGGQIKPLPLSFKVHAIPNSSKFFIYSGSALSSQASPEAPHLEANLTG